MYNEAIEKFKTKYVFHCFSPKVIIRKNLLQKTSGN